MHDGNAWLIDGDVVDVPETAQRHTDLYRGHRWFDPDVDELAGTLRRVASDPRAAWQHSAGARQELIERFGPGAIAARIGALADAVVQRPGRRAAPVARAEARERCGIEHSRDIAVLALADELVERPELLSRFGARVGAHDDVSLVIYSPGADPAELEPRLLDAVSAAGLDHEDSADLLAMPLGAEADERLLAASVHALLSEREPAWAFAALPPFGDLALRRERQAVPSEL